jgi:hypothetical protein
VAQAYWHPPTPLFERIERATASQVLLSRFTLGPVTVTLEQTPLSEVERAFPRSRIQAAGDAAEYVAWLCYTWGLGSQRSVLWVESGELGGNAQAVLGFTLLRVPATARVDRRCSSLPDSGPGLRLPHPMRLGATRSDVIHALGNPSEEHGDTLGYFYEGHFLPDRRTPGDTGYDVTSSLCILLRAGRVVRIEVWKVSTT